MILENLKNFVKKKDYILCIDSDGTAMNVMNIKHKRCFGPCLVAEWNLEKWKDQILSLWNNVNLYRKTRGNNRFLTLYIVLKEIDAKYTSIEGLNELKKWTETEPQLSNQSLAEAIKSSDTPILKKALSWSQAVNAQTLLLTYDDKRPFSGVHKFLEVAYLQADIAIVSSAGFAIIKEEWEYHDLIRYVGVIAAQEDGSKAVCLQKLQEKGYKRENMLMIGDALSDMRAAEDSGIFFFPIIPDHEIDCWEKLHEKYFDMFINGNFENIEKELVGNFYQFFGGQ